MKINNDLHAVKQLIINHIGLFLNVFMINTYINGVISQKNSYKICAQKKMYLALQGAYHQHKNINMIKAF